mmetsp:Transcript_8806/g.18622  ORF Transcript_8806/g.18622 Transcript_8806/m.18622 type:complete len:203 (+) Transcript_8806:1922-2530(+)
MRASLLSLWRILFLFETPQNHSSGVRDIESCLHIVPRSIMSLCCLIADSTIWIRWDNSFTTCSLSVFSRNCSSSSFDANIFFWSNSLRKLSNLFISSFKRASFPCRQCSLFSRSACSLSISSCCVLMDILSINISRRLFVNSLIEHFSSVRWWCLESISLLSYNFSSAAFFFFGSQILIRFNLVLMRVISLVFAMRLYPIHL